MLLDSVILSFIVMQSVMNISLLPERVEGWAWAIVGVFQIFVFVIYLIALLTEITEIKDKLNTIISKNYSGQDDIEHNVG